MRTGVRRPGFVIGLTISIVLLSGCAKPAQPVVQPVQSPEPQAATPKVEAPAPQPQSAPTSSQAAPGPAQPQPVPATGPQVVGHGTIDLPGHPAEPFTFIEDKAIGVTVEIGSRSVVLRAPTYDAGGLVGPDFSPKLWSDDLDGDGQPEILLEGGIGAHSYGLWVYRFNQVSSDFTRLGDIAASTSLRVVMAPSGRKVVLKTNRDYDRPLGVMANLSSFYTWTGRDFREVPCPIAVCAQTFVASSAPLSSDSIVNGPYSVLMGRPLAEIETLLTPPAAKNKDLWGEYWSYPDRGLDLAASQGALVKLTQTKGKVTATLSIGDQLSAEELKTYLESYENPGHYRKRIYDDGATIDVYATGGKVERAELQPDPGPTQ